MPRYRGGAAPAVSKHQGSTSGRHLLCHAEPAKCREGVSELVDVILVIGSPNSSNSNRLRELGEQCGIPSFLIDSAADINPAWFKNAKAVGIAAGASAPEVLVTEVVVYLKALAPSEEVEELTVIEEDVEFLLPKELVTIEPANRASLPPPNPFLLQANFPSSPICRKSCTTPSPNRRIFLCIFRALC